MWRFSPRRGDSGGSASQGPLEGRTVDVGKINVTVRQTIAQGGCAFVYLARCNQTGRNYALKHIVCGGNQEMLETTKKEVAILVAMKGHPNIVTLLGHAVVEGGVTTSGGASRASNSSAEFLLLMDYCEKTLVAAMDARGGVWYDEKTLLTLFRDVCNGVFALHCQTPPIAHRDIKAENVLLASDGSWKLCDFGSATTKHGRFERMEEMGVEEDVIRKTTTPAYRSPEMWDLYQKEVLSEKVDIWALGCLLYRMAFFRSCFDGESKLQVLNGRYAIPESNKFSPPVVALIKDMLAPLPASRPTVAEIWQRVNQLLPPESRRPGGPDKPPRSYSAPSAHKKQYERLLQQQKRQASKAQSPAPPPTQNQRNSSGGAPGFTPTPAQAPAAAPAGSFWASFDDAPFSSTPAQPSTKGGPASHASTAAPETASANQHPERTSSAGGSSNATATPSHAQPTWQAGQDTAPKKGSAGPQGSAPRKPAPGGGDGAEGGYVCSWSQPAKTVEPNGTEQSASAPGPKDGAAEKGDPKGASSKGGAAAPVTLATTVNADGRDELRAEIERLRGELRRVMASREELRDINNKLSVVVQAQTSEIAALNARLAGAAKPGPGGSGRREEGAGAASDRVRGGGSEVGGSQRRQSAGGPELHLRMEDLGAPMVVKDDYSVADAGSTGQGKQQGQQQSRSSAPAAAPAHGAQNGKVQGSAAGGKQWDSFSNGATNPQGWAAF